MPMPPSGELAVTGEDCPATGAWAVAARPESVATMVKGNIMPPYEGKSVTWHYLGSASPSTAGTHQAG